MFSIWCLIIRGGFAWNSKRNTNKPEKEDGDGHCCEERSERKEGQGERLN